MVMFKRLVAPLALSTVMLVGLGPDAAEAAIRCNTWVTVSTTAKTYSPCNQTTIGPWTSPVGGCLRWVSWRRYQQRINTTNFDLQRRTLLENEVQAQWKVTLGPVSYTKTQTIPGSHTTTVIASSTTVGTYQCALSPGVRVESDIEELLDVRFALAA